MEEECAMIQKIWTLKHEPKLREIVLLNNIPSEVYNSIIGNLKILDVSYGMDRQLMDDGGYIALIVGESQPLIQKEYMNLLEEFHLSRDEVEFSDLLCEEESGRRWKSDTYIAGSEFVLVIVYLEEV